MWAYVTQNVCNQKFLFLIRIGGRETAVTPGKNETRWDYDAESFCSL